MRSILPLLPASVVLLTTFVASAFDSAKWLAKREELSRDADRLRCEYSNAVARITTPSEGLTIPLETYPDGAVRTSLYARRAQIFEKSTLVWAEGLELAKFDADGQKKLKLEADRCVIDRQTKTGWVEGHAKVTQGKTVFEGDGVYFSSPKNFVSAYLHSDIKSADLRFGGVQ